jgi:hypothetical protein
MKIKAFDAFLLKKLQPEIEAALAELGRRHGITIRTGRAHFSERTADLKLELAVIGGDGRPARREAEEFEKYHAMFGLEAADLGRTIVARPRGASPSRAGAEPAQVPDRHGTCARWQVGAVHRRRGREDLRGPPAQAVVIDPVVLAADAWYGVAVGEAAPASTRKQRGCQ